MADSTLFKDGIDVSVVDHYARWLSKAAPSVGVTFKRAAFKRTAMRGLEDLELKARVKQIAAALFEQCGGDYLQGLAALLEMLKLEDRKKVEHLHFAHWPMAQFVEEYGVDHLEASAEAMKEITKRFSCEFAVRPFLVRYPKKMMKIMNAWAKDESVHVRRNASEGVRPRLPWGMRLNHFVEDPTPVFRLLAKLRKDPEEYVRRSVSNCLNDIAKDHPQQLMDVLEQWDRSPDKNSEWIKARALRTLVKAGDRRALKLLGYGRPSVRVEKLRLDAKRYAVGDVCTLSFVIVSTSKRAQRLAVDYRFHYVKANGTRTPKVFKLKTLELDPGARIEITKRQHLKPISTRRYYSGRHAVDVQVNGQTFEPVEFDLEAK